VSSCAEKCLKDFYNNLRPNFENMSYEEEYKILEILIEQSLSNKDQIRLTGFEWISMFLQKYSLILHSNKKVPQKNKSKSTFPLVKGEIISIEDTDEKNERKIPFNLFPDILESILTSVNHLDDAISKLANSSNSTLLSIIEAPEFYNMNIKLFEEKLSMFLNVDKDSTVDLILTWVKKLFMKFNENMFSSLDMFIENITKIITHKNENLFNKLMDFLCEVAKSKEGNIEIIMRKILDKLCSEKSLLETKGLIILKRLCTILPVQRIYLTFAEVLLKMSVNTIC